MTPIKVGDERAADHHRDDNQRRDPAHIRKPGVRGQYRRARDGEQQPRERKRLPQTRQHAGRETRECEVREAPRDIRWQRVPSAATPA